MQARVPPDCVVRVPLEDLEEMIGNLLDNACKWTRSCVGVSAVADNGRVVIAVEDDGGGLSAAMRGQVLQRGVRADEASPGSGLGLAIVRDLAEAYGGAIALEQSPLGGVSARLTLPG
jgi:signal transduction histidine kinase